MRKRLWRGAIVALAAALCLAPNVARADDAAPVPIDEAHFPDPQFREFIDKEEYDKDEDGALSAEELAAVTSMDCRNCYSTYFVTQGRRLYSLQGIEYFTSLTELDCSENLISKLDLSSNAKLTRIDCWSNLLTSLDTSKNTELVTLCCDNNKLTSLNIQGNTNLERLDCYQNQLTELDVSDCTARLELSCQNNKLTKLKLTRTVTELNCEENQLTSLDLSDCIYLSSLDCSNNRLTSLDLTMRDSAMRLTCTDNAYTVDVEKGRTFDLSALPGSFDEAKASDWTGGTASDGILTVNDDAASVTYRYDCGYGQIATFTLNVNYAVNFDTGGGAKVDGQPVAAGSKAIRPASDPTWAGHVFCGWYADKGCTEAFDFGSAVTGATTVYAKWVEDAKAPTITGIEDGKTYCAAQTVTVTDEHLASVTLDGASVALGDGQTSYELDLAAGGEHTVTATDKAGNSASVTVAVNDGHTWNENWSYDATGHWHECSVCGERGDIAEHAGGTVTCSNKAKCETCGEKYGKLDPKNHESLEHMAAKAATAEAEGNTEYWRCTGCGKLFSDAAATEEIERADTVIPKLDPKKDEGGKTDGGNGGSGGQNANGSGSNASNGSASEANGATHSTTRTTEATITTTGKANAALAQTGDGSAAAAPLALVAGLTALGIALCAKRREA